MASTKHWPTNTGRPRTGLPLDAMWERHYAFEWMGTPPDIAAQQRLPLPGSMPWDGNYQAPPVGRRAWSKTW